MYEKPRGLVYFETVVSTLALLISLCSLGGSIWNYRELKFAKAVSSAPEFQIERDSGSGIRVANKGNGSGRIVQIAFYIDHKCIVANPGHVARQNADRIYNEFLNPFGMKLALAVREIDRPKEAVFVGTREPAIDEVLRPGDVIDILKFIPAISLSPEARRNISSLLDDFSISISYCSDYNDCKWNASDSQGKIIDYNTLHCSPAS